MNFSGLHQPPRWVTLAGIDNTKWLKPLFVRLCSRPLLRGASPSLKVHAFGRSIWLPRPGGTAPRHPPARPTALPVDRAGFSSLRIPGKFLNTPMARARHSTNFGYGPPKRSYSRQGEHILILDRHRPHGRWSERQPLVSCLGPHIIAGL